MSISPSVSMTTSDSDSLVSRNRVAFLDGLRGLAAVAVFITHMLEQLSPGFQQMRGRYFDLGTCGVTVFFLCSGFIIPISLERSGSLRHFWVRRIFRLYPLYWVSVMLIAAAKVLWPDASQATFAGDPLGDILAHLTMFQMFLGVPNMVPVYWTLFFELIFYLILSLLFVLKVHRATIPITIVLLCSTILLEALLPIVSAQRYPPGLLGVFLMMFNGILFYRVYSGELRVRHMVPLLLLSLLALAGSAFVGATLDGRPFAYFYMATAWGVGYLIFGVAFLLRTRTFQPTLLYLGQISYSLYLMHPVVLLWLPSIGTPLVTAVSWMALVFTISALTYRWIEQPTMNLGRSFSKRP